MKSEGNNTVPKMRNGWAGQCGSSTNHPNEWKRRSGLLGACILLAAISWGVFGQTLCHEFVNYDDHGYVYENYAVKGGLTWEGLAWAFGRLHGEQTYWHPLTWVSHMLDCQLYGLKPWGHHLTNVLLHSVNTLLVFFVFRRMTGAFWRSAVVAAIFAVHPLQVDTVAWVAERKNLLSTLFWLLTTWAYVRYGERPGLARYALVLLLFVLGLMCKPVLVTLPFVLVLLDYWPLCRFQPTALNLGFSTLGRLIVEKAPLFLLAAASSAVTLAAHHGLGMINVAANKLLDQRIDNALASYVRYLGKTFWPSNLVVFYPYPDAWPLWEVVFSGLLLCAVSITAISLWRSRPWLLVGWFWFLGVLVPFIGLVQAGEQAMADRFMYVPLLGLLIIVVWGAFDLGMQCRCQVLAPGGGLRRRRLILGGFFTIVIAALVVCARGQTAYWRDSFSLWNHAIASTQGNVVAYANLGLDRLEKGKLDEAITHLQEALAIQPGLAEAHTGLAYALLKKGEVKEAVIHLQTALEIQPGSAEAHAGLANALFKQGQIDEAVAHWQQALDLKPSYAEAHGNLGDALFQQGRASEAILQYQQLAKLEPGDAHAQFSLGHALAEAGRIREAIWHYRAALKIHYQTVPPLNNLAWILATSPEASIRSGAEAVKLAEEANRVSGSENAGILDTLAAAYAEAGRFTEAVKTAERALQLADSQGNRTLADKLSKELGLYRASLPYHTAP